MCLRKTVNGQMQCKKFSNINNITVGTNYEKAGQHSVQSARRRLCLWAPGLCGASRAVFMALGCRFALPGQRLPVLSVRPVPGTHQLPFCSPSQRAVRARGRKDGGSTVTVSCLCSAAHADTNGCTSGPSVSTELLIPGTH